MYTGQVHLSSIYECLRNHTLYVNRVNDEESVYFDNPVSFNVSLTPWTNQHLATSRNNLIAALEKSKPHQRRWKDARAKLAPLESEGTLKRKSTSTHLMTEYNRFDGQCSGDGPHTRQVQPNAGIEIGRSGETQLHSCDQTAGSSEAEAKKIAREAVKALATRLGVKA